MIMVGHAGVKELERIAFRRLGMTTMVDLRAALAGKDILIFAARDTRIIRMLFQGPAARVRSSRCIQELAQHD
jgi:hypothetical protein